MKSQKIDFYETLQLTRKASQQQIKQSYKRLALLHHPDKNNGTEASKQKFRQISQAYTVLNDPKKRDNYDKYGVADLEGMDFEQFMGNFDGFDEFLNQFLSFNTFQAMFSGMNKKKTKKAGVARGRAKGRQKNMSNKDMNDLAKMMMGMSGMGGLGGLGGLGGMGLGGDLDSEMDIAMLQALLQGGMIDQQQLEQMQKQLNEMILNSQDEQQDDQDLTEQQMQILQFGQKNTQTKKTGKKKKKVETFCKLDGLKIQKDQILMHFSEKHMEEFKKWRDETVKTGKQGSGTGNGAKGKKQEGEIQY